MQSTATHDSPGPVETSFTETRDLFLSSPTAESEFHLWRRNPRRRVVVPVVEAHRTRILYDLTVADIEEVVHTTDHALGEVEWAEVKPIKKLVNWNPDFAFTHLFAYMIEHRHEVPTWQTFREFIWYDELGKSIGDQARREIDAQIEQHGTPRRIANDAAHWRIGNAYYGLLRETYVIIHLRALGLDVRCHPLADALFHADAWYGRTVISIRVANENYTSGEDGRKIRPDELLSDADPSFRFETLELDKATYADRGRPHLPTRRQIADLAERLRASW
jgi:hypothetical protein